MCQPYKTGMRDGKEKEHCMRTDGVCLFFLDFLNRIPKTVLFFFYYFSPCSEHCRASDLFCHAGYTAWAGGYIP